MSKNKRKVSLKILPLYLLIALEVLVALGTISYLLLLNRIYPGVYVGNLNLGGLTSTQAKQQIALLSSQRTSQTLNFSYQNKDYKIDLGSLNESLDTESLVNKSFEYGHFKFYFPKVYLPIFKSLSPQVQTQIAAISSGINQEAVDSKFSFSGDEISTTPSQDGLSLDTEALNKEILAYLNTGEKPSSNLPVKKVSPKLSEFQAQELKKELSQIKLTPITLGFKDNSFSLDLPTILSMLDLSNTRSTLASVNLFGQNVSLENLTLNDQEYSDVKLSLNQDQLKSYLQNLANQINRPSVEPVFVLDQSKHKVTDFAPPQEGYSLNIEKASSLIENRLAAADFREITLPVDITPPKNRLVNELGIKELLGEGASHFYHSIPNRIYNLELAASRVNGTLISPGDTFSFNAVVGDISAATGYKQGYVIKSGKTVLDDGGGVCQDSTTLFRAVLNAGLPVLERTAHAYRVGYYEQGFPPGLDATTYYPSVDFKFKNDTPASILIEAHADDATETLYYDLYGTSDGRISTVSTPLILSQTPPLPDVHQDDPTLPKGTTKQVDWSAWGAKVVFSRTVTKDGQTLIQETYHSNYQPWANVYLMGTQ